VLEPPEGALALLGLNGVDLAGARTAVEDKHAPARLIELTVIGGFAADELSEPVEQIARERIRTGHAFGLTQEGKRPLEITVSQHGHDTEDTTIVVSTQSPRVGKLGGKRGRHFQGGNRRG
jgi:hypothetical protein